MHKDHALCNCMGQGTVVEEVFVSRKDWDMVCIAPLLHTAPHMGLGDINLLDLLGKDQLLDLSDMDHQMEEGEDQSHRRHSFFHVLVVWGIP